MVAEDDRQLHPSSFGVVVMTKHQEAILAFLRANPGYHSIGAILNGAIRPAFNYQGRGSVGLVAPLHALMRQGLVLSKYGDRDRSTFPTRGRGQAPTSSRVFAAMSLDVAIPDKGGLTLRQLEHVTAVMRGERKA